MSVPSVSLGDDLIGRAAKRRRSRSARVASWDHTGLNEDAFVVMPGETAVLADLEGPGAITHLWFVQGCRVILGPGLFDARQAGTAMVEFNNALGYNWEVNDPDYYRKVVIKMYWDDQEHPSVIAPLGDFFGVGNSMPASFQSMPFTVSVKDDSERQYGGPAAFNCFLQMPFNRRARIEVENQGDHPYVQYFYIDYELFAEELPDDTLYFHAHWRRNNPCNGWGPDLQVNSLETQVPNLDGKDNYVILDTEGAGNYIGCVHTVNHFTGTWWGEGDDMIWIDEDFDPDGTAGWPPSMHGTGGEDYFSHGWGMQKINYPFQGTIIHEEDVPGLQVHYRFHLADPVRFNERIRVTMEHGHGNHLADDWSTTAYWYQTLPGPRLDILPVEQRLPRKAEGPSIRDLPTVDRTKLDPLRQSMYEQRDARMAEFTAQRNEWFERRAAETRERAAKNRELAAAVRAKFMTSTSR
ncbi:glycoside hydrolase family 172 protein [Streptomyces sp. NPDC001307]|uniref:glycoside hydrolase family 172 protein n=1 Tax=Streptomyces sp. NPDC001307 TaxID=3364560 RepID=UPI0036C65CD5